MYDPNIPKKSKIWENIVCNLASIIAVWLLIYSRTPFFAVGAWPSRMMEPVSLYGAAVPCDDDVTAPGVVLRKKHLKLTSLHEQN